MASGLPWELRLTLRTGSVYYFVDRGLSSPEPHYFIVINSDPIGQEVLVLNVISSQVDKVRHRRALLPGTLVELQPGNYDELSKPSIVDCNNVFRRSLAELIELSVHGAVEPKMQVSDTIIAELRAAVLASPMVEQDIKDLL
jgi:hypothetical protein